MSQTFRRDPDASPFAARRAGFQRAEKRQTFEDRRDARRFRAREQLATLMDRDAARDAGERGSL
jgi:hypothetical protein